MDASTASSLLWEDMTLTSVSEGDAAAFRRRRGHTSAAGDVSAMGEARERHPSSVNLPSTKRDGLDDVVLSVTIFATSAAGCAGRRPASGEVVVLELLSTRETLMSSGAATDGLLAVAAASATEAIGTASRPPQTGASPSSSSNNISSSTSSPSSFEPPPAVKEPGAEAGNATGTPGADRARVLFRRVLWWPACVAAPRPSRREATAAARGGAGGESIPSFVALGRGRCAREGGVATRGQERAGGAGTRSREEDTLSREDGMPGRGRRLFDDGDGDKIREDAAFAGEEDDHYENDQLVSKGNPPNGSSLRRQTTTHCDLDAHREEEERVADAADGECHGESRPPEVDVPSASVSNVKVRDQSSVSPC